jgi:Glutamate racemase
MIIGIIDSGRGGLAVAEAIKEEEDTLLILLDKSFFPYGTKSKEFLMKRAFYLTEHLIKKGADIVILACNTLSILTLDFLKYSFEIPILGVFNYFEPYLTKENVILGSSNTIQYVQKNFDMDGIDGTDLIRAIEKKEEYASLLKRYNFSSYHFVLLACTHFLNIPQDQLPFQALSQIAWLKEDIRKIKNDLKRSL